MFRVYKGLLNPINVIIKKKKSPHAIQRFVVSKTVVYSSFNRESSYLESTIGPLIMHTKIELVKKKTMCKTKIKHGD